MNLLRPNRPITGYLAAIPFAVLFCALPQQSLAGPTDLADVPLANIGLESVDVLPNIMLHISNTPGMSYPYLPDVNLFMSHKRDSTSLISCPETQSNVIDSTTLPILSNPCHQLNAINGVYYHPAVTYLPPVDANGDPMGSVSGNWKAENDSTFTAVPRDGYNQNPSTTTTNLVIGYPNQRYCRLDCKESAADADGNYLYPTWVAAVVGGLGAGTYQTTPYLGPPSYYTADVKWCTGYTVSDGAPIAGSGNCQPTKDTTHVNAILSNMKVTRIVPERNSYDKALTRTDCQGSTCTYLEEMRNFANWFVWYRTRGAALRTVMLRAFKDVRGSPDNNDPNDSNHLHARVGMVTTNIKDTDINVKDADKSGGSVYLALDTFDATQRGKFYNRLTNMTYSSSGLELPRTLAMIGRLYGGKFTNARDPVNGSCQRNYTIVASDGAWTAVGGTSNLKTTASNAEVTIKNTPAPSEAEKYSTTISYNPDYGSPCETDTSKIVQCPMTGACPPATRPECAATDYLPAQNFVLLADVAYYYYHTDLRKNADGTDKPGFEQKNVPTTGSDLTMDDMAPWQHMTTFVVGLGLDSSLAYRPDYRTATEGDFWDIRRGVKNWPVTGTGTGFDYLEKMNDMWHAAVNGRGTYFSAKNPQELLDALQTTLSTIGAANGTGAAAALSSLYPVEGDNYTYIANYRTVHWDGDLLAYAIDVNTNELDTNALWSAQKILDGKITGDCGDNSMGRTIYFSKPEGSTATLKEFRWTNLDSTQQGYFDASKVGELSQFQSNAALASQSAGARLVDYLRGENRYEKRTRNSAFQTACAGPAQAVYRAREHVLGDIVHAAPAYVGQPAYDYSDSGYAAFKNDSANRINKTIYVGANEGILHAFDAVNGAERWAYIPPKVMPNLYKLADEHYSKKHLYSVNGPIVTGDINVGGSSWKTILVGALGKGGRSIYALDITDNRTPKPLWTFENDNLGYTYGLPRITKLKDGTWVVVIASGYNNINPGNGEGHVFVINAATGGLIKTLSTGAGDTGTPSGLAALNGYVPEVESDNTVLRIYGGDLNGNLWGFDINSGRVYKIASGLRPITAPPQVSHVDNDSYVALFFGTGRYLGQTDLKVLPEMTGTIYAIKDKTILPGGTETSAIPLVSTSELTKVTGSATGTVNWLTGSGWYYPLPRTGERVAISAQKYLDTLVVASVLPVALSSCEMGGTGYLYFFDAKNGTGGLHKEFSTPLAGVTIYQGLDKQGYVVTVGGDGTKVIMALPPPDDDGGGGGGGGGGGQASGSSTRIMWQESNSN